VPEGADTRVDAIVLEIHIEATPETVFEFFTDPAKYVRWKGKMARLDARPGGLYEVDVTDQALARGEFLEVDRPRRVVFTWGWEGSDTVPPGSSTVEVDLEPDGDGTLLRLTHRDLPTAGEREQHSMGWDHFLGRLVIAAPGGDPGPDPQQQAQSM
jgi:uncharacterized protein YndB with AHSA1/START domain